MSSLGQSSWLEEFSALIDKTWVMWPMELRAESQLNHWDYQQGKGSSGIRAEVQFLEARMNVLAGEKTSTSRGETGISAWKLLVATLRF